MICNPYRGCDFGPWAEYVVGPGPHFSIRRRRHCRYCGNCEDEFVKTAFREEVNNFHEQQKRLEDYGDKYLWTKLRKHRRW